jgi:uroporphyrinogen decarboxylase
MSASPSPQTNGRDLILAAFRHQTTERVPWVPFAGVHAGFLKGYTARQVYTDEEVLVESLLEVDRLYQPDGLPVVFDLQLEAEILGCKVIWSDTTPPLVVEHVLQAAPVVPDLLPEPDQGRLPLVLSAMRRLRTGIGNRVALFGLITGPFTLASHLRGTELFNDSIERPDYLSDLLGYTARVAQRMADLYIDAGMDVIAVVDPMVSQISPQVFTRFMAEPFTGLFDRIRARGAYSSFFVCGDATRNIEVMCQTRPDGLAVDENVDLPAAKTITDRYDLVLQGNIPLSTCMLAGTQPDNMKYVVDLLDAVDHHNLIISPGCDMPYATPPANAIGVAETIRDVERSRRLLADYHAPDLDTSLVVLPDYAHLPRPLVEVFTLDSASCAACSYMLAVAQRAAQALPGQVDLVEYKAVQPGNIARMKAMGVPNLPAILINGRLRYSSLIPGVSQLLDELKEFLK